MANLLKWTWDQCIHYGLRFLRWVWHWLLVLANWRKSSTVPPVGNRLLLKSATSLASDIREGKVKSEDVIKAYVQRILEVEPYINATVERRFPDALEEAKAVDALVASGVQTPEQLLDEKPLLGVPFSVKGLIGVKGLRCTAGSLYFEDVRASEDSDVVSLLKKAGAICLVTTNTAEIGMGFETNNPLHGKTCNPYDTCRTCGGSSGGEGALVGAAGSVFGIGNDLAGSIRLPCFYNGIFGHKPSRGVVSNTGVFPVPDPEVAKFLSTGPMCRYAEDLVTTMNVLNSNTLIVPMKFGNPVDFDKVKIYCKFSLGDIPAVPEVDGEYIQVFKKAIEHFEDTHGLVVKDLTSPDLSKTPAIVIHSLVSSISNMTKTLTGGKGDIKPAVELMKYFVGKSRFSLGPLTVMNFCKFPLIYKSSKVEQYQKLAQDIERDLEEVLDENSVLLLPTFPQTAPYHYESPLLLWSTSYTCLFNILGFPATQCTLGLNSKGMPLGLQVIGRRGNDTLTVAFAVELEKAFGGWVSPNRNDI